MSTSKKTKPVFVRFTDSDMKKIKKHIKSTRTPAVATAVRESTLAVVNDAELRDKVLGVPFSK